MIWKFVLFLKMKIMRILEKNSRFSFDVLKQMANSLKKSDNLIVDMAQKSVKQRLAETL